MSYRHKHIKPKIRDLRPRKSILRQPWFWVLLVCVLFAGTGAYGVLWWPKFQVQQVEILGNEKVTAQEVETIAWQNIQKNFFGISSQSIFLFNGGALRQHLLDSVPGIETVQVHKKLPQTISITIKERVPMAVFCAATERCFSLDANGVIFGSERSVLQNEIVVRNATEIQVSIGQKVVERTVMEAIVKIQKSLQDNFQVSVQGVLVSNPLIVTTSEQWKIYFNPDEDVDLQITKMELLLKEQISPSARKNLQYIYLQYKDRAYYK